MNNDNELIEIANTIVETDFTYRGMCWQGDSFVKCPYNEPINCQSCLTAKSILDKGYRKINENEIIISKEELNKNYVSVKMYELSKAFHDVKCAEFEKLCYDYHKLQHKIDENNEKIANEIADYIAQARKETAREILSMYSLSDTFSSFQNKVCEKYGVDLGEE